MSQNSYRINTSVLELLSQFLFFFKISYYITEVKIINIDKHIN